jgi:maltose alpha-D-glucosyltransferase / alpha-amylase
LATKTDDPAFAPEPFMQSDFMTWAASLRSDADATLALLERQCETLSGAVLIDVLVLLKRRQQVLERIDACTSSWARMIKIRYHGEYDLSQVLVAQNDFMIIDFEGDSEPPLADRRQKHSPLRDVVSMLRSFDYVMHTTLLSIGAERQEDFPTLESMGQEWKGEVERVFLQAYQESTEDSPLFASWDEMRGLLELFILERALYELRRELEQRPEWVRIPVRAILRFSD